MKYDLHIHTYHSKCASLKPAEILKIAQKKQLEGIAITDHNTIKGALEVSKLNKDRNFEIIIGSEIKTNWGDLLIYYQTEEIKEREFFQVIDKARQQGAITSIAHPYRLIGRFKGDIIKVKKCCIETFNSKALPFENKKAQTIAKKYGFTGTGGSDAHFKFDIGNGYTIFEDDLKKAIKKKQLTTGGITRCGILSETMSFIKKRFY